MSTERPPHPISLTVADDLRRSRVTVFFRLLIAIPHLVWWYLWNIVALVVAVLTWVCTLVIGRPPRPFHRFLGAFIRYQTHVWAFVTLVGNPFPGFVGARGSFPVDLVTPVEPERQNRLGVFFRIVLALPALVLDRVLSYVLLVVAIFAWFAALVRGRMPDGFRDLGAYVLRYTGQAHGYVFLQTARYPHSSPRDEFTTAADGVTSPASTPAP